MQGEKMRRPKTELLQVTFEEKSVPVSAITCAKPCEVKEKELRKRAARFVLYGEPTFCVNRTETGFALLACEEDFYAMTYAGATAVKAKVYSFEKTDAEMFSLAERIKSERLRAMDESYLMKRLISEFGLTQDTVASLIGRSRPAVANTLRLLTLAPEVVGLIEKGDLSAGHARALVKVPKDKQFAFAQSVVANGYTVRETEKATQAFLNAAKKERKKTSPAKAAQRKELVQKMREVFKTRVTLIGGEKGRIAIEYYSDDDLYRFEELMEMLLQ